MKYLLSIFLVLSVISTEVYIMYFSSDDCIICLMDTPIEGETESESESQENAKDENKIEVIPSTLSNFGEIYLSQDMWNLFQYTSKGALENITPPPEQY